LPTAATLAARRKWEKLYLGHADCPSSASTTSPSSGSIPSTKMRKNVLRPASRCGYLSSGSQSYQQLLQHQKSTDQSQIVLVYLWFVCKQMRLTSLADRKRREAAVPRGFVADVEHAHTKTSETHRRSRQLENIDLPSFVSTNEHYASFFKVRTQPAT